MQELSERLKQLYKSGTTYVTAHNVHLMSSNPQHENVRYVTSASGVVEMLILENNPKDKTLNATIDIRLFPFPNVAKRQLPLFRHMIPDPEYPNSTVFTDAEGQVFVRISHTFDTTKDLVMFPTVSTGKKCKDTCRRRCLDHQIQSPYVYRQK